MNVLELLEGDGERVWAHRAQNNLHSNQKPLCANLTSLVKKSLNSIKDNELVHINIKTPTITGTVNCKKKKKSGALSFSVRAGAPCESASLTH